MDNSETQIEKLATIQVPRAIEAGITLNHTGERLLRIFAAEHDELSKSIRGTATFIINQKRKVLLDQADARCEAERADIRSSHAADYHRATYQAEFNSLRERFSDQINSCIKEMYHEQDAANEHHQSAMLEAQRRFDAAIEAFAETGVASHIPSRESHEQALDHMRGEHARGFDARRVRYDEKRRLLEKEREQLVNQVYRKSSAETKAITITIEAEIEEARKHCLEIKEEINKVADTFKAEIAKALGEDNSACREASSTVKTALANLSSTCKNARIALWKHLQDATALDLKQEIQKLPAQEGN